MNKIWVIPFSFISGLLVTGAIWLLNYLYNNYKKKKKVANLYYNYFEYRIIWWLSLINGFFEIVLYSYCILFNYHLFIAVWLGMKTALRWNLEKKTVNNVLKEDIEIQKYNDTKFFYLRFLIGNTLNIIFSYIISIIIKGGDNYFLTFNILRQYSSLRCPELYEKESHLTG